MLNIAGNKDDPYYRYKMPAVETTVLNRKGGTTVVDNTLAIAATLEREEKHIGKYLQHYLKRPVRLQNNKWTMSGIVEQQAIQDIIYKYIGDFVLCAYCNNPETIYTKKSLVCKSCGGETKLSK